MDARNSKAWKIATYICCALLMLLLPFSPARGDAVSDWTAIAERMVSSSGQPRAAQELAAVYAAMFEAMNFVEGKYVPRFLVRPPTPLGVSGEVEAIGAAHHVLAQLYPGQKAFLDAALERSLAAYPDRDATSRARIWGRHLGGNVSASILSAPDRPANRALAPASGNSWSSTAIRSIEGRMLQPIERARICALLSIAASAVYSAAADAKAGYGSVVPCVSCAVGAAVHVILETELGSGGLAEVSANEKAPARGYLIPVRNDADESRSTKAGEEMGTKIGLQALTHYRRIK
jgi:hypothetical protein